MSIQTRSSPRQRDDWRSSVRRIDPGTAFGLRTLSLSGLLHPMILLPREPTIPRSRHHDSRMFRRAMSAVRGQSFSFFPFGRARFLLFRDRASLLFFLSHRIFSPVQINSGLVLSNDRDKIHSPRKLARPAARRSPLLAKSNSFFARTWTSTSQFYTRRSGFGLRTTGDDHDRALGVTHHVFGDAADKGMFKSCAAMRGSDDKINFGLAGCITDFLDRMAGADFGLNRHAPQKIHLLKRVHLSAGLFLPPLRPARRDGRPRGQRTRNWYTDTSHERDGAWH